MQIKADSNWTDDVVTRFWDYYALRSRSDADYFSGQVGHGVVHLLRLLSALPRDRVLDLGCGVGLLLEAFVDAGVSCSGVDSSAESVAATNRRLTGRAGWNGAFLQGSSDARIGLQSFELITCCETLEHLNDAHLVATLQDIQAALRPGGAVLITTPNAEDLTDGQVYCPFCDSEFHHMQHVRSFNRATLTETLTDAGFVVTMCTNMDLTLFQEAACPQFPHWKVASLYSINRALWLRRRRANLPALSRPGPNLVAFARKPRDSSHA